MAATCSFTMSETASPVNRWPKMWTFTPYEFICKSWTAQPERFNLDPFHQMPGLYT